MPKRPPVRNEESLPSDESVTGSPTVIPPDPSGIRLDDFAASEILLKLVRYRINRSSEKGIPFPHHVFAGGRGMGKRTLAYIIARELGINLQVADCRYLKQPKDILPYLTNASYGSLVALLHTDSVTSSCASWLETAVSNSRIDITLGEGLNSRTISMKLQPFTLIGVTENLGAVPAFLRTAATVLEFGPVPSEALTKLICRQIKNCPYALARMIVEECKPTPGDAVSVARKLIEYGNAVADGKLSRTIIQQALRDLGLRPILSSAEESPTRETIPASVRRYVWQRDGGKCVRCGSNLRLEYDHIIAVSNGGSNTERNIQLLCEACNRRKGASLFD